jgi:uncharacterized membrane protein (UPF0127 family)
MDQKALARVRRNLRLKNVEVVSGPIGLGLGLMFRKRPARGYGMLFDMHYTARHGIWMLFMRFPIDIFFIAADGKIIETKRNVPPLRLAKPSTWRTYKPKEPCRYVVEVAS